MTSDLLDLPFDQYTRHRIVAQVADSARRVHGWPTLRVLDVGGYPCLTPRFLPADGVTVIDITVVPGAQPGSYVRADGAELPFPDDAFDLVVSLDSLEHVPRPRRADYVSELLRVSRGYVLLLAPFAREEVVLAERLLAEFVRVVNQEEQPQLREHREYGLPDFDEWLAFVDLRGLAHVAFTSGFVYNWLPMMLLKHFVLSLSDAADLHQAIDRFYNVVLQSSDARSPGYRQGMVVSLLGHTSVLEEMGHQLAPTGTADRLEVIERLEHLGLVMKAAELHVAARKDDRLREDLIAKDRHILNLEAALAEMQRQRDAASATVEERVAAERARGDALDERVRALETHLDAVRNGRVMRALEAVDRLRGRAS
jgi:hypothetical protein